MKINSIVQSEYIWWLLLGLLVLTRVILLTIFGSASFAYILERHFSEFILGIIFIIFPYVFYQVFSVFPFQSIKNKKSTINVSGSGAHNVTVINTPDREAGIESKDTIGALKEMVANANLLAEKIKHPRS